MSVDKLLNWSCQMTKFALTQSINYARYWGLKSLQEMLECSDADIQTCPVEISATPEIHGARGVEIDGHIGGKDFSITCSLKKFRGMWYLSLVGIKIDDGNPILITDQELQWKFDHEGYSSNEPLHG